MTPEVPSAVSFRGIARSTLILTGGTALAQVLTFGRELFIAAQVGLSARLDALLIALVLPSALVSVLTSGAAAALVPAYLERRHLGGRLDARRFAGTIMVGLGSAGLVLWAAITLLAGGIVAVAGPGLAPEAQAAAVGYLRLVAPLAFILSLSATLSGVCQAEERFSVIAASNLAAPAVMLASTLLLWPVLELGAVAVGMLLGYLAVLAVLLWGTLLASATPVPALRRDEEIRRFVRHAAPLMGSSLLLQLGTIGDRAVASFLGPGAVSALRYAEALARAPLAAIGPAWGAAVYPALVRSAIGGRESSLASSVERGLRYSIGIVLPLAGLVAAVAPLAVAVAYERGEFSAEAARTTALGVAGFAPLLLLLIVQPLLVGGMNARRRGGLMLLGGLINVITNLSLDVVLGFWLGVAGIALASSASLGITLLYLAWCLKQGDGLELAPIGGTLLRAMVAAAPGSIVVALLAWNRLLPTDGVAGLLALGVVGVLGMAAYLAIARSLRLVEPGMVVGVFTTRLSAMAGRGGSA
jgi:putative peptidoglycan lipid II flippase